MCTDSPVHPPTASPAWPDQQETSTPMVVTISGALVATISGATGGGPPQTSTTIRTGATSPSPQTATTLRTLTDRAAHAKVAAQHQITEMRHILHRNLGGLARSVEAGGDELSDLLKGAHLALDKTGVSSSQQKMAVIIEEAQLAIFIHHKYLETLAAAYVQLSDVPVKTKTVLLIVGLRKEVVEPGTRPADAIWHTLKHVNIALASRRSSQLTRRSWPLQDVKFNIAMTIQASGPRQLPRKDRLMRMLKLSEDGTWIRGVAKHFGPAIAGLFAWEAAYIRCLWALALLGLVFTLLQGILSVAAYDTIRPFFCVALIVFGASVAEFADPEERIQCIRDRRSCFVPASPDSILSGQVSAASELSRISMSENGDVPRSQYVDGRPLYIRWAHSLILVPSILLELILISTVFAGLFWFEMWVIFEWGQCRRINQEHRQMNGDQSGYPCRSSDMYRGFWPALFLESLPSILEGILFEALAGISKSLATIICDQQNWRLQREYDFAFFLQVVILEMAGKVGFVSVLAFAFAPRWGGVNCASAPDTILLGSMSLSCIKAGVPYELRKKMLQRAMRGPMLVSMLVGLVVKVLVPQLVAYMLWASRTRSAVEKQRMSACAPCMYCGRALLRILGLIFIFDCEAVGGLAFILRKMPVVVKKEERLSMKISVNPDWPEDDSVQPKSLFQDDPRNVEFGPVSVLALQLRGAMGEGKSLAALEAAMHEGLRKEFCILDEYIELVLHFTYFSFFGLVWPLGSVFALVNYMLEYKFDSLKLAFVRRRALPRVDDNLHKLLKTATSIVAMLAIPFNVCLMLLPFEQLVVWFPNHFSNDAEGTNHHYDAVGREELVLARYWHWWVPIWAITSAILLVFAHMIRSSIRYHRKSNEALETTMDV